MINSMIENRSKGNILKPAKFIPPGHLAKARAYGLKMLRVDGDSNSYSSTSGNSPQLKDQERQRTSNHAVGKISAHVLTLYFGENELKDGNFTEESSLLDILKMCKKFIDINSVGYKLMDGDGKPLRSDKDVLAMLEEHEYVKNIDVYVEVDKTVEPLPFKLPEDNSTVGQAAKVPEVRDDVSVLDASFEKTRKVRGKNKNKKVARLSCGEKLEVEFYNNRVVGNNHSSWSRHLGKIVRNKHICPLRVQSWKEITEPEKQHMWDEVKECFSNSEMELYREHTLEHMRILWAAWRSSLNKDYVVPCKTKYDAIKNVPEGMNKEDWEWLVVNKFCTEKFQKISTQNSTNRLNGAMPHRTGSRSHRQLLYEMGGKLGNPPDVSTIFKLTRQRKWEFVQEDAQKKYDEIVDLVKSNTSLPLIEVVERSFGPQKHSNVFTFGGGMKRKHLKDSKSTYIEELEVNLRQKEEENNLMKKRMDSLEVRLARIESESQPAANVPPIVDKDVEQGM